MFFLISIIVFHIVAIVGIVPYEMLWGGRLKSESEMYFFESVSLLINLVMLAAVIVKRAWPTKKIKWVNAVLWIMFVLFLLNTIGNIFSSNQMEKIIFTPITLILSVLCLILVLKKQDKI